MIKKLKAEVAELKAKLAKAMLGKVEYAATKTDKAVLVYDAEELEVGIEVFVEDEEGNRTPAEDGIYTMEDGKRIKVTEGKVEEILEPEEEAETTEEVTEEMAEDAPSEEYATKAEVEALAATVAELTAIVEALVAKVDGAAEEFSARLSKVEKAPAGKTPAKEFKTAEEVVTGDKAIDAKLANIRRFKK